jgi:hypothetical protein
MVNVATRQHGDKTTWRQDNMATRQHGDKTTWRQDNMAIRQHGDKWATHFSDHVNEVTKDFHVMFGIVGITKDIKNCMQCSTNLKRIKDKNDLQNSFLCKE